MGESNRQHKPIDLFELNGRLIAGKESLPVPAPDPLAELARSVEGDGRVGSADTDPDEEVRADDWSSARAQAARPPKPGFKTPHTAAVAPPAGIHASRYLAPMEQTHSPQRKRLGMSTSFYVGASAVLIAVMLAVYFVRPGGFALSLLGQHADAIVAEVPAAVTIAALAITPNPTAAIAFPADAAGGAELSSISEHATSTAFATLRDQTLARPPAAMSPEAKTVDPASAEPAPVVSAPPPPEIPTDEQEQMLLRAATMLRQGDIAGARTVFARLDRLGNGRASFALAQTYDPVMLKQWSVVGIEPDPNKAVQFYRRALAEGISAAQKHLTASASLGR